MQEVASQPSHLKSAAPPYSININKSTEAETAEAGEDPPNQSTNSVSELETNSATIIESVPEENYKDQASKAGGSSGGGEAKEILIHSKSEAARPSLLDLDAPSNPQRMEDKAVEIEPQLQSAAAVRVEAVRFDPGLTEHLIVGGLVVGLLGTLISGLLKLFEHVFNSWNTTYKYYKIWAMKEKHLIQFCNSTQQFCTFNFVKSEEVKL